MLKQIDSNGSSNGVSNAVYVSNGANVRKTRTTISKTQRIKNAREIRRLGLTYKDAADMFNVTEGTVCNWLKLAKLVNPAKGRLAIVRSYKPTQLAVNKAAVRSGKPLNGTKVMTLSEAVDRVEQEAMSTPSVGLLQTAIAEAKTRLAKVTDEIVISLTAAVRAEELPRLREKARAELLSELKEKFSSLPSASDAAVSKLS